MSNQSKRFVFRQYDGRGDHRDDRFRPSRIGQWLGPNRRIGWSVPTPFVLLPAHSGLKVCKIGDWIILDMDNGGWYFNDAKYLPDYEK